MELDLANKKYYTEYIHIFYYLLFFFKATGIKLTLYINLLSYIIIMIINYPFLQNQLPITSLG